MRSLSLRLVRGLTPALHARAQDRRQAMATYQLNVNGQSKQVNVDPSTPLLWVLREELKMTGTKYGCGISACGACTVHVLSLIHISEPTRQAEISYAVFCLKKKKKKKKKKIKKNKK